MFVSVFNELNPIRCGGGPGDMAMTEKSMLPIHFWILIWGNYKLAMIGFQPT